MKTSIFTLLFLFPFLLFAQHEENKSIYKGPVDLPDFAFRSAADSSAFTCTRLVKGKPVVVIFFDPDCDHCQQEATWISEQIEKFSKINLLFVSWGEMKPIRGFAEKYFSKVKITPGMINFTKDTQYKIDKWFGDSPVPSIHIYGSDWKHRQSFFNETGVEEILKFAK